MCLSVPGKWRGVFLACYNPPEIDRFYFVACPLFCPFSLGYSLSLLAGDSFRFFPLFLFLSLSLSLFALFVFAFTDPAFSVEYNQETSPVEEEEKSKEMQTEPAFSLMTSGDE